MYGELAFWLCFVVVSSKKKIGRCSTNAYYYIYALYIHTIVCAVCAYIYHYDLWWNDHNCTTGAYMCVCVLFVCCLCDASAWFVFVGQTTMLRPEHWKEIKELLIESRKIERWVECGSVLDVAVRHIQVKKEFLSSTEYVCSCPIL